MHWFVGLHEGYIDCRYPHIAGGAERRKDGAVQVGRGGADTPRQPCMMHVPAGVHCEGLVAVVPCTLTQAAVALDYAFVFALTESIVSHRLQVRSTGD